LDREPDQAANQPWALTRYSSAFEEQLLDENPDAMRVRRQTVEHNFGTAMT
jgi:hypothetical protein